jgi:mannose-6-phosphate isomerase-like protein (cupin superfamily)
MPLAENSVAGKGYSVRRLAEAPTVPCPCGMSTRILTRTDGPLANFHVTCITDSAKHYHKHCTEIYYILDGTGTLEVGDDLVEVEPGTLVVIEPGTAHRLVSAAGVRTVVLGIPALLDDDEYFVDT